MNIETKIFEHSYHYVIYTSFHDVFPAITVIYHRDNKQISMSYGSGGTKHINDYLKFSNEMTEVWKIVSKIVKYYKSHSNHHVF